MMLFKNMICQILKFVNQIYKLITSAKRRMIFSKRKIIA